MATLTRTINENVGSKNLHILVYSDIDDGDTQGATYNNIVSTHGNLTDVPTTSTNTAVDISLSSGTLTYHTGEDNRTGQVGLLSDG